MFFYSSVVSSIRRINTLHNTGGIDDMSELPISSRAVISYVIFTVHVNTVHAKKREGKYYLGCSKFLSLISLRCFAVIKNCFVCNFSLTDGSGGDMMLG
jgi:hypothetical protein